MARTFSNLDPEHSPNDFGEFLRWALLDRLTGRRRRRPPGPAARQVPASLDLVRCGSAARLTWIGHASFLASLGSSHILIDPVFSDRVGGLIRRHGSPGLLVEQLPRSSAVLVSHAHYDHLDRPSIDALPRDVPRIAPLGVGEIIRGWGHTGVIELDWWESVELERERVTLVPARHWSRRWRSGLNRALWGGFVIESDAGSIYHAGDSASFAGFAAIGERFPGLLAAMLPIGSYDPAWFMERQHMNPEQAGEAFLSLDAGSLVPMHWGTFQLTDEPLCEPERRMRRWWEERRPEGKRLHSLAVGQTISLETA